MRPLLCLLLIGVPAVQPGAKAGSWPQWRGPAGTGLSLETNLVLAWSTTNHILWRAPLAGRGHSSTAVQGDRLDVTAKIEGEAIAGAKAPVHRLEGEVCRHPAWAVAVANRILLTAEDGRTFVVRAGPKFEVEAVNPLDESVFASLAIADGRIYVRGDKHLFCIGR